VVTDREVFRLTVPEMVTPGYLQVVPSMGRGIGTVCPVSELASEPSAQ
jgi:hypothetical protein